MERLMTSIWAKRAGGRWIVATMLVASVTVASGATRHNDRPAAYPGDLMASYSAEPCGPLGHLQAGPGRYIQLAPGGPVAGARDMSPGEWARRAVDQAGVYRDAATGRPTADVMVFVHGYAISDRKTIVKTRMLRDSLRGAGFLGSVVAYRWPSIQSGVPWSYAPHINLAERTAQRFVTDCVDPIRHAGPRGIDVRVHVISHSLGATFVRAAFENAGPTPDGRPRLGSQIFLAGDAPTSLFGLAPANHSLAAAAADAHQSINYFSRRDAVLRASNLSRLGTSPRLGRSGADACLVAAGVIDVDCSDRSRRVDTEAYVAAFDARVCAYDRAASAYAESHPERSGFEIFFDRLVGGSDGVEVFYRSHEWYFEDPCIAADLTARIQTGARR